MTKSLTKTEVKEAVKEAVSDFLSKEAFLKRQEVIINEVDIPQLGYRIRVRTLSAREVAEHQALFLTDDVEQKKKEIVRMKFLYVGRCLCDEKGNLLFPGDEADGLGNLPAREIEFLFNACTSVNPFGNENEVAKEVKNSESTEGEDSSSA